MLYVFAFIVGFCSIFFGIVGMYHYLDAPTKYGLKAESYVLIVIVSIMMGLVFTAMVYPIN
jgi:hypothetical protein